MTQRTVRFDPELMPGHPTIRFGACSECARYRRQVALLFALLVATVFCLVCALFFHSPRVVYVMAPSVGIRARDGGLIGPAVIVDPALVGPAGVYQGAGR